MAQSPTPLSSSPSKPKAAPSRGLGALLGRFSPSGTLARFRSGLGLGLCLLLSLLLAALLFRFYAPALDARAMNYAQLGRNVSSGNGFSTSVILPFAAPLSEGRVVAGTPYFSDFSHEPLFPLLAGLVFIVLSPGDSALIALSLGLFVVSAALLFSLAMRLSNGNFAVAFGSVAVYLLSSSTLGIASSGTPATLSTALLLWLLLLLTPRLPKAAPPVSAEDETKSPKKKRRVKDNPRRAQTLLARRFGWAGVVLGLCYLSNYLLLFPAFILAVLWVSQQPDGWSRDTVRRFALGFVLVSMPWWIRNFRLTGNPFFTLQWFELAMQTRAFPGQSLLNDFAQGKIGSLVAVGPGLGDILRKTLRGLQDYFHLLPQTINPYLMPFVLVGLGLRSRFLPVERCRVKTSVISALLVFVFVLSLLGRRDTAFLAPLAPLLCFIGASALVELWTLWSEQNERARDGEGRATWSRSQAKAFGRTRALAVLTLLALLFFPLAPVVSAIAKRQNARAVPPRVSALKQMGQPKALPSKRAVVSDVPEEIAWYANRPAVLVPAKESDLSGLEKIQPLSSLFLSRGAGAGTGGVPTPWREIYRGQRVLKGYVKGVVSQEGDTLFLRNPTAPEARETARKRPRDPQAQLNLAYALLDSNQPAPAKAAFSAALALQPKWTPAILGRGTANLQTRAFDAALGDFQTALALAPRSMTAQMGIADALLAKGQSARVIPVYENVLADYPDQLTAVNNLAYLYSQRGDDLLRALQMARRAAQLSPGNLEVLDTLGWACYRTGRTDEAVAILSQVSQLRPDNAVSLYHLGKAQLALKKPDEGYANIQKSLNPNLNLPATERADAQRLIAGR